MKKKIVSYVLSTIIIFSVSYGSTMLVSASLPAPDEYNKEVAELAKNIEDTYSIKVIYPMRTDGYSAIGVASLSTLNDSLNYASVSFVRQLSNYYYDNYGNYLTFEFTYLPKGQNSIDPASLGFFSSKSSTIQLFLPTSGTKMTMSGCSPFTILHELGHAYNLFLSNIYGYDKLKAQWSGANTPMTYDMKATKNPNKTIFSSVYGCKSYEEDFADTFAYVFGANRAGLGISERLYNTDGSTTGLGQKVNYIESTINQFFDNKDSIQEKISTMRIAPSSLKYRGLVLAGNSLEYIDLNPPHGVLENVLDSLKISPVRTEWVYEVGGWQVWDSTGGIYLVFPGANYVTLKIPIKKSVG